jgi:hypothetical protein
VEQTQQQGPWQRELDAFMRAFSGAFLFGIPSLYTLETWDLGTFTDPPKLLGLLGIALLASLALAHLSGFRLLTHMLFRMLF